MKQYDFSCFQKEQYGIKKFSICIFSDTVDYFYQVEETELYDLASITKLFTLNLLYNLKKEGKINFSDDITTYLEFPYLSSVKIIDLIKMRGILKTEKGLKEAASYQEFQSILKNVKITNLDQAEYTDIGFCILGNLIEVVTHRSLKENFEGLFKSLSMNHTKILPGEEYQLFGNGNELHLPHDPKTRISHGISGAAGVFSNAIDLKIYALKLMNYEVFDREFVQELFHYQFQDQKNRNRTYAGLYTYTFGFPTYVGKSFSLQTIAHQGYTGAMFLVDFESRITNILLFDAISNGAKTKQDNFFEGYQILQNKVEQISKER